MAQRGGIQAESSALNKLRKQRDPGDPEATGICRAEYQRRELHREETLQIFIIVHFSLWLYTNLGVHRTKLHEAWQRTTLRKLKVKQFSGLGDDD